MLGGSCWRRLDRRPCKSGVGRRRFRRQTRGPVAHRKDHFKWAEEHAAKMHEGCELFLQPEWSKRDEMMPFIVDYVMTNPKWKVSLQTHKYMHIP